MLASILPAESAYFETIGLHPISRVPFDHVRLERPGGEWAVSSIGFYTAPSKFSVVMPYLLGVAAGVPDYAGVALSAADAAAALSTQLRTVLQFLADHPALAGFVPWVGIAPDDGSLLRTSDSVPALDMGEMLWAAAALIGQLEGAADPALQEVAQLARAFAERVDFGRFYSQGQGALHGEAIVDRGTGEWRLTGGYFLGDPYEGSLAPLWGVLHGHVPLRAWDSLFTPAVEYLTGSGQTLTALMGFRASMHEWWGLLFVPWLRSSFAPLFRNTLIAHADFAARHPTQLPGLRATAYDPSLVYQQMGVPPLASAPAGRDDVVTPYGTAMAMLIDRDAGAAWLRSLSGRPELRTAWGMLESLGQDGTAPIMTADGKAMTLAAASGGALAGVEQYLRARRDPSGRLTMYDWTLELLERKHDQLLQARAGRPILTPPLPVSLPPAQADGEEGAGAEPSAAPTPSTPIPASTPAGAPDRDVLPTWRPEHGSLTFARDESGGYRFAGGRAWRGGYVSPVGLGAYRSIVLVVRNLSGRSMSVSAEIKQEAAYLLGGKSLLRLASGEGQQRMALSIPAGVAGTFNYFAVSDPEGPFALESVSLSSSTS